ncbi:hypothetical protein M5E82_15710 [Parabacteroides distasonis]|nr:hypothetical protein M5E82_15710 [Parabacteroides distasonis]
MKHVSHYVQPGAKRLVTDGAYKDVLAFVNRDNSVVIVAGNSGTTDKPVSFKVNNSIYSPVLKANSVNTLLIK